MTVEVLLLFVCGGLTLLGYMIAINAHGPMRMGLSYLLATAMLVGTVWVVVQHLNQSVEQRMQQELAQKSQQMQKTEEQLRAQQDAYQKMASGKERSGYAVKFSATLANATTLASSLLNADLQDRSVDLDGLKERAAAAVRKVDDAKKELALLEPADAAFVASLAQVKDALQLMGEAAYYWRIYYSSEDEDQEALRERILRQKSRSAYETLQKVGSVVAAMQ